MHSRSSPGSFAVARARRWIAAAGRVTRGRRAVLVAGAIVVLGGWAAAPAQAQVTAQTLIGRAVSDDSQSKEVSAAIARFRDRDVDACRAMLERAHNANQKLPPPGVMMAILWLSVNQLGPARAELEDTVTKFPDDPEPYLMLADLSFQERRVTEADALFGRATTLIDAFTANPKRKRDFDIRANAGNAAVAEARRQWESARTFLTKWLELDPDSASGHQRLGVALFHLGQEKEALAEFTEARKLDSKAAQPELTLARLYDDAQRHDEAAALVEKAVKAAPEDPQVLLAAAQWYLGRNELEQAAARADAALRLDPRSLEAKIVRGAIARVARDYETAEKLFDEAHIQSPGNFPASNSLALVLAESDERADLQRALEMAEANAKLHRESSPQQINSLTTLAWVFYRLGRREDAEKIIEQLSQNSALTSDGAYYAARMLADRGDKTRAREIIEQVLPREPVFATRADAVELLAKLKEEADKDPPPEPAAKP